MAIEKFSKEDFEKFLENYEYIPLGLIQGEYAYKLPLDGQASIMIRSSVRASGSAAGTGKDSIRLWFIDNNGKSLGSKGSEYTTRVKGWQKRLSTKILEFTKRRVMAGDCPQCHKPFKIYKNRKSGVWFCICRNHGKRVNGNMATEGLFAPASYTEADKVVKTPETPVNDKLNGFLDNPFEDETPETMVSGFTPSKYQKDIFDFVENGTGHGVVEGVAGCGKTTTNVEALKLVPRSLKTKYAAFNKHVERDISSKAPSYVNVSTFHSWGLANIKAAHPKAKIDQWKIFNLIDDHSKVERDVKFNMSKIIGLLKGHLLEPTSVNITAISIAFNIEIDEKDHSFIRQIFINSIKDFSRIDFDDMVYYAAAGLVPCEKFDFVFVDEAQDMNLGQYMLAKRSLSDNGRMLLIGDPYQSIYAFRGAHIGIMSEMAEEMNAKIMPLPVSYRAPRAIVDHVNGNYGHIRFEGAEGAKNGVVANIDYDQFLSKVSTTDAVLCRLNAPLVEPCFELIRSGVKASILGRDIGQGLVKLIESRHLKRVHNLNDLLDEINSYCQKEANKAIKKRQEGRAQLLADQAETIFALSADCETIQELKTKTKATFSDKKEGVVFSTVHKAKGLEWETVFVIGPKGNHKMGNPEQETNIRYVRDTRTLDKLYFVSE